MEVRSFNKILFGGAPLLEQIEEKEELEKQLGEMTFTQNTDDDDNATEENIDEDSIHKSQYLTLEDLEGKWIILSILGTIVVSLIIFVALAKKLKKPHKNLDAEKSTIRVKKLNVGLAPMTKIEKKSMSDADIVNDDLEEQIVKSQSETQIQDIAIAKCIALKLKSVENSLDHTNAELEKVRGEKEDLEKQLAEIIFTQNTDDDNAAEENINEDSIHKSVLNRMIEDCDQMIGKLNEKIEYLKLEDHNNEIEPK